MKSSYSDTLTVASFPGESYHSSTPLSCGIATILVAEDDRMVRDIAVRILQRAGYATLTATDGEEALRVFRENRDDVSLVLLDAVMPKLNGHDVFRKIRTTHPDVKVIFCTGYDPVTCRAGEILSENLRLLQKPFPPEDLLDAVREELPASPRSRFRVDSHSFPTIETIPDQENHDGTDSGCR